MDQGSKTGKICFSTDFKDLKDGFDKSLEDLLLLLSAMHILWRAFV